MLNLTALFIGLSDNVLQSLLSKRIGMFPLVGAGSTPLLKGGPVGPPCIYFFKEVQK